ncbi:hypothetical protein [Streptomyces genisteinicus]|uniref:Lipoprotein n=1 Tax=Streptomyces genisteinicus TaxID=2768068 RepID=A0A7H0HR22_9ACTN|nr:hypothetical protein [Streptomyces genisteinicus]QNP62988.1 hypothetical protein IAG43_08545 [Streptomyces genisteinicus]
MRTTSSTNTPRAARTVLAVALIVVATACSAGERDHGRVAGTATAPASPRAVSGSLEDIARKADCEPNIQTDAAELRQANCATADGRYVLATFATEDGRRAWLDEADDYGGTYLVGGTWVAVGDEKVVAALRGRLGGSVRTGTDHGSHPGGGTPGGGHADHDGHEDHDGHDGHEGHEETHGG